MKLVLAFVVLVFYTLQVKCMLMPFWDFTSRLADPCYGPGRVEVNQRLTYGQIQPVANSLENFISLVERIEKNGTARGASGSQQQDAIAVAYTLLRRFSAKGIIDDENTQTKNFKQTDEGEIVYKILTAFLPSTSGGNTELEQALTEDEKCSLFFMLSHSVNRTHRPEDGDEFLQKSPVMQRAIPQTLRPREQGVVSVHRDQYAAVDLAPVVAGILFGKYPNATVRSLIEKMHTFSSTDQLTGISYNRTNPLYTATIAGVLGYIAIQKDKLQTMQQVFGPGGHWTNPLCTMDYQLDRSANVTDVTFATLRGAIDGFLLGFYGRRFVEGGPKKFAASDLLRQYYGPRGLPIEGEPNTRLTFCNRATLMKQWLTSERNELLEQVQASAEVRHVVSTKSAIQDGNSLRSMADWAIQQLDGVLNSQEFRLTSDEEELCLQAAMTSSTKKIVESPADVFVVMDSVRSETNPPDSQQEIIALLGNLLDLHFTHLDDPSKHGADGGTISLLSSYRGSVMKNLQALAYNSSNPSCPGCRIAYPDNTMGYGTSLRDSEIITMLTNMMDKFKKDRLSWAAAPAKVVVYFKSGNLVESDRRDLDRAVKDFRQKLPDVRLIAVSPRKESVSAIVISDSEDVVVPKASSVRQTAGDIKVKIAEVPAVLQYSDCYIQPSSVGNQQAEYTGFVTPGYYQYWAMYPEYFLKSFNMRFTFTASQNSEVTVCYNRAIRHPEEDVRNCQLTSATNGQVEIQVSNPCKKQTVHNCAPLYFSIYGGDIRKPNALTDPNADARCDEPGCTAPDQIKFTIQHTGVSCNGALCLLSSPFQLLLTALTVLYMVLK